MTDEDDVFDEDLVRELGLDPEDLNGPKINKKRRVAEETSAPKPQTNQASRPQTAPPPRPQTAPVQTPPKVAQKPATPPPASEAKVRESVPVNPADFEEQSLRMSRDIPVQLAAVLSKKSLKLQNILDFKPGDVVEFKKQPQDLLDLVANGKLVAKAELVLIDGQLGARIVKLIK